MFKNLKRRSLSTLMVTAIAAAGLPAFAGSHQIQLRMSTPASETDARSVALQDVFAPAVAAFGSYEPHYNASLIKQNSELEAIASGDLGTTLRCRSRPQGGSCLEKAVCCRRSVPLAAATPMLRAAASPDPSPSRSRITVISASTRAPASASRLCWKHTRATKMLKRPAGRRCSQYVSMQKRNAPPWRTCWKRSCQLDGFARVLSSKRLMS